MKNISNDHNNVMKIDVGVLIQGRITSQVIITDENKYMFTLRLSNGYNVLVIADEIKTVRDIKLLQGKYAQLSNDAKRNHTKPRIPFGSNRYAVYYSASEFDILKVENKHGRY